MYQLGYYTHYLELKRKFPQFQFSYPRDWSLKEYGTLFIYDLIRSTGAKRVLELGCGYDTFFASHMPAIGVEYWCIDKSNNYLGVGKDETRFLSVVEERRRLGATYIDGLLGDGTPGLPENSFDIVFSISVLEHIDDRTMPSVVTEIKRTLRPGGRSAHTIDIYPRSDRAAKWHYFSKQARLEVPPPYYDRWEFDGNYTTFIEQPKVRYMIYNALAHGDPLKNGAPYVSQFATMLSVALKPLA